MKTGTSIQIMKVSHELHFSHRIFLGLVLCCSCFMSGCKGPVTFPTHVVFQSDRDGVNQIYIMNPDGSDQKRLTNDAFNNEMPAISELGLKIAFRSDKSGANEIWVILSDGTLLTQVTHLGGASTPRWGRNARIVFSAFGPGNSEPDVYSMLSDGSDLKHLTTDPASDIEAFYSPDSKKIVFTSTRSGESDIYIMNEDGSGQTPLVTNPANDAEASFNSDGTKIAFWSNRDGNGEIYVMNADGSAQTNISNNPALDFEPTFSPNTDEITFASMRDGNWEIYIMNADGSNVRRLTNNAALDRAPDWK